jgi:hypothetical protein
MSVVQATSSSFPSLSVEHDWVARARFGWPKQMAIYSLIYNWNEVISHCGLDLYSLMISDIEHFSYTYWQFVCLLLKMAIHVICSFFLFCGTGV